MNNSDLLNSEKLDESVSNLINESLLDGLTENTSLLNASGEEFSYATARKQVKELTGCKKPAPLVGRILNPLLNLNYKKKKKEYDDCMKNYKASLEAQKKEVAASTQRKEEVEAELNRVKSELENSSAERTGSDRVVTDTFLGMPKAVGITVAIVGGLALLVGGVVLVKKLRAN
jgi:hypothetical protein